jgi:hypothetical protein
MGENTKSGEFLQKPAETLVYAVYIERRNPFRICYIIYSSTACGWEGTLAPSRRTLFKPLQICLKLSTMTYLTHARTVVWPDFPFSSPFVGKRDMPHAAGEEENIY